MNGVLILELVVGLILSVIILVFFIWGIKNGSFDDAKKQTDGLLFDSEDDLNDAINRERRIKKNLEKKDKR